MGRSDSTRGYCLGPGGGLGSEFHWSQCSQSFRSLSQLLVSMSDTHPSLGWYHTENQSSRDDSTGDRSRSILHAHQCPQDGVRHCVLPSRFPFCNSAYFPNTFLSRGTRLSVLPQRKHTRRFADAGSHVPSVSCTLIFWVQLQSHFHREVFSDFLGYIPSPPGSHNPLARS
jgi:hypothetical protein